jgi:GMP synthase (glutamine-hydrolysing)
MSDLQSQRILILDFGSQYTQLIARRVREIGVFSEIRPWDISEADITEFNPNGIILSGGPESVTEGATAPSAPDCVFTMGLPFWVFVTVCKPWPSQLGGKVESSDVREFGYAQIKVENLCNLLADAKDQTNDQGDALLDVWMSHGDKVTGYSRGLRINGVYAHHVRLLGCLMPQEISMPFNFTLR